MAVHPEYQGKGFGRELVQQGLERAKHDPEGDLPVCVVSADGKEGFYQKCGFGDIEGYTSKAGGSDNPLMRAAIGGGAVMWTK
jgi:ribosomal protein S18 acetylase RimI-like enzyme